MRSPACRGAGWGFRSGGCLCGQAGEVLGRLGVFEEIKGLPEKVPLTLSVTSLPQFLICNVGESQSYLLRCLCGLMEMALAVQQLLPSLSLAVEAF